MVNENYHARGARMPFEPADPAFQLQPDPQWPDLRVGDIVKPNIRARRRQVEPVRVGRIMEIAGELARVRWQDRSEEEFQLPYLIKIKTK